MCVCYEVTTLRHNTIDSSYNTTVNVGGGLYRKQCLIRHGDIDVHCVESANAIQEKEWNLRMTFNYIHQS